MSKFKKVLLMCTAYVLVAAFAIGGTIAYLKSTDSDVNVMTLGNVSIEQLEYERVLNEDGTYQTIHSDMYDENGYKLQPFTQAKPLYPATGKVTGWGDKVHFDQIEGAAGWQQVLDGINNVQDKFVFVKNTGESDAYVRTLVALEYGSNTEDIVHVSIGGFWDWNKFGIVEIDNNNYLLYEIVYKGGTTRDVGGILPAGHVTPSSLNQVYLDTKATNEDCIALDGNQNGTYDILVLSQAIQAQGFDDAQTALDTGFGKVNAENAAKWFDGIEYPILGTQVSADNLADIDFTAENTKFVFNGEFGAVAISELGEGSVLFFNNATVGDLSISDDAVIEGIATINKINAVRDSVDMISVTLRDADLNVAGEVGVRNTDGKSVLNIENTKLESATIYVGQHVNNHKSALAELNIVDSYVSCEENGLGSTINVWGRSGVKATIYDSEIYTYSRGWHQSEDANDNSITFQGATSIDIDIQRSNMHLYGARSIINARQYGSEATTITTNMEESLIWVVTKSNHGENTIPVWGFDESSINNSILLFTKNVHQSTPAVFKSFVYGNPVIHGDYHVTTQCQWDAPIALADGQTVTFANDANVSVYDGAGNVEFVKNGSAKVVVEDGAVVKNISGIN